MKKENIYNEHILDNDSFTVYPFSEKRLEEWEKGFYGVIVYYPNGLVWLASISNNFQKIPIGGRIFSGRVNAYVIVAERSCDEKRTWLEWA